MPKINPFTGRPAIPKVVKPRVKLHDWYFTHRMVHGMADGEKIHAEATNYSPTAALAETADTIYELVGPEFPLHVTTPPEMVAAMIETFMLDYWENMIGAAVVAGIYLAFMWWAIQHIGKGPQS